MGVLSFLGVAPERPARKYPKGLSPEGRAQLDVFYEQLDANERHNRMLLKMAKVRHRRDVFSSLAQASAFNPEITRVATAVAGATIAAASNVPDVAQSMTTNVRAKTALHKLETVLNPFQVVGWGMMGAAAVGQTVDVFKGVADIFKRDTETKSVAFDIADGGDTYAGAVVPPPGPFLVPPQGGAVEGGQAQRPVPSVPLTAPSAEWAPPQREPPPPQQPPVETWVPERPPSTVTTIPVGDDGLGAGDLAAAAAAAAAARALAKKKGGKPPKRGPGPRQVDRYQDAYRGPGIPGSQDRPYTPVRGPNDEAPTDTPVQRDPDGTPRGYRNAPTSNVPSGRLPLVQGPNGPVLAGPLGTQLPFGSAAGGAISGGLRGLAALGGKILRAGAPTAGVLAASGPAGATSAEVAPSQGPSRRALGAPSASRSNRERRQGERA